MTDIIWMFAAGVLLVVGMIGCFVPVVSGPLVSFSGILCMLGSTRYAPSWLVVALFAILAALAVVGDYVVPMLGAKRFRCSKWGTVGCFVGTVAGLFFLPIGLLVGPFLGAFLGELLSGRQIGEAAKGGLGAFLGFLAGTALKFIICFCMSLCFVALLVMR